MVECSISLDNIFASLADGTRRDIFERVTGVELSVSEIAEPYDMSLAAVSKHLKILEQARLIIKRKAGKQRMVRASPTALQDAASYLNRYEQMWNERMDRLETLLKEDEK